MLSRRRLGPPSLRWVFDSLAITLALLLLVSCVTAPPSSDIVESDEAAPAVKSVDSTVEKDDETEKIDSESPPAPAVSDRETAPSTPAVPPQQDESIENRVRRIVESLSMQERVGQMFMVKIPESEDFFTDGIMANWGFYPGGYILFSENLISRKQVIGLTTEMVYQSPLPPFIGIDEEGGRVARAGSIEGLGVPHLPSAAVQRVSATPDAIRAGARALGEALLSLGITVDFAPVADLDDSGYIGDRSFGTDPAATAEYVAAMVSGLQDAGVVSVVKHFPGHGGVTEDSHYGSVVSQRDLDSLQREDLLPFLSGIDAGAAGIMTAHVRFPRIPESEELPATFSPFFLSGLLRDRLRFDGLVFTDALDMGAVARYWAPEISALEAVRAGADVLLLSPDPRLAHQSILDALQSGNISEERINQSVRRIIRTKIEMGILIENERTVNINQ